MRLTTVTNVSLDGVTQGHRRIDGGTLPGGGGPEEDGSGGFERLGWGPPLLDDEASTFISQAFQRADAFLLGRRTYEIFAGTWGAGMTGARRVAGFRDRTSSFLNQRGATAPTDPPLIQGTPSARR